jgi:Rv2525c-like, glycoside hydrolase-like domain
MLYGIDSPTASTTLIAALPTLKTTDVPDWVWNKAAGDSAGAPISFIMRYLAAHGNGNLNITEVLAISDAGFKVVSIYEVGNTLATMTEATGYAHGKDAWTCAARVSQTLGTPVYFAVDFSPAPADLPKVTAYFEGVRRSLDEYNRDQSAPAGQDLYAIGVYGQPHVCTHCRDTESTTTPGNKLATWFWRWGGHGAWAGANVRQLYGPNIYGADKDASKHYFDSKGNVMGEKFCGLGVDFDISEVDTVEQVGGWFIPPADAPPDE